MRNLKVCEALPHSDQKNDASPSADSNKSSMAKEAFLDGSLENFGQDISAVDHKQLSVVDLSQG